ncbi:hypothetical protein Agub_g6654 [Astrephomene gubernaculifera]|uniref:Glutathione-disulfide reductase n=1 Tax=Astrephomene gubernaculifera TaxID=47775 RepID=A0AAD3DRJ3_9CHLO|nr:hypothetical protein Agub_g6654 [Astrephomene gubernaculifera]
MNVAKLTTGLPRQCFRTAPCRIVRGMVAARSVTTGAAASSTPSGSGDFDFDLFTIGAGSGGVRGSRFAASYGAKVAVCELPFDYVSSERAGGVGGTCVLRGCVPKKLMVYAAQYAEEFKAAEGFGWTLPAGAVQHSWTSFIEAKRKELQRLNNAYKNTLNNAKVTLIEGRGRLVDPHTVEVDGRRYRARNILIAVGGRASRLDIPGAELCITSDEALELQECPKKIAVLGGGYIAVEFSGIFGRLGAEVHTCYRQPLPLRGFDGEVRKFAADQYTAAGLHLHPGVTPVKVVRQDDGRLTLTVQHGGPTGHTEELRDLDQVLMATGRVPNTSGLGLSEAGVALGPRGQVRVDEFCRTAVPSIWAVGDVIDRIQLTPVALMEGMAVAKSIALNQPSQPDYWAVPSAVFSHPEIASVGYTEEAAAEVYGDLDIYSTSFRPMKNTISGSPLRTFMKIVVDAASQKVVGMHMVGAEAAEIMQGFAVAVKLGATKAQMDSVVGIHPSAAEEFVTMRSVTRKVRKPEPAAAS